MLQSLARNAYTKPVETWVGVERSHFYSFTFAALQVHEEIQELEIRNDIQSPIIRVLKRAHLSQIFLRKQETVVSFWFDHHTAERPNDNLGQNEVEHDLDSMESSMAPPHF